ncbi:hypothetical protein BY996DRAFT_6577029 [Phakopsora pachyrhizi]|nr:hypothetical protein BY996DRAFT_6577029 [Phakopsora pachyrhizi]
MSQCGRAKDNPVSFQVLAITKNSTHEFGGHSLEVNSDSEIDELNESNDTEDDGESYESDLHESKSDETDHLKISTNVNCRGPIKVQPQSKILQKQKASSQNKEQNFKEAINSDSSSNTPTYYCKRKRYLSGVFIPHDVEFMTEVDGLEYGSTPSDESSSKSFTHEKPKCNQKGLSKSKQPDSLKSACKSPAYLIDLVGASQNSSGPSIRDPSGNPSKTLSGLTGSCKAPIGKGGQGKGGAERGFCWISQDFEEEGVAVEENGWRHLKEEQKLGGGAHQGQSGWSKTTGAMDL